MSSQNWYRPDIDGLRAVAIVPVVLYHAGASWLSGGFIGVDVFFVISGYLIARLVDRDITAGTFSIARFYERRARRILPALLTVLAVTLALGWIWSFPRDLVSLSRSAFATLLFVSNVHFWAATDYFAPAAESLPLLHTWSVGVEEQFYLLFPLTMLLATRVRRSTLLLLVGGTVVSSFLLSMWATNNAPVAAFYLMPARAWELAIGVLLALGSDRVALRRSTREIMAWVGLAAIATGLVVIDRSTAFPGAAAVLPSVGTALIILAGENGSTSAGRLLSAGWVRFVGLISYSLYLWHWPILVYMRTATGETQLPWQQGAVAIAISVTVAAVSWRWIEQPFRDRTRFDHSRFFALVGGAVAVVVVAIGSIVGSRGASGRFTADEYAAVGLTEEENAAWEEQESCRDRLAADGLCRFGPMDRDAVLLWGDSHALSAWAGMKAASAATDVPVLLAGFVACPPALGVEVGTSESSREECRTGNDDILRFVESGSEKLAAIVLHARWPLHHTGEHSPYETRTGKRYSSAFTGPAGTTTDPAEVLAAGLDSLLTRLSSLGIPVFVVGSVPDMGYEVPAAAVRRMRSGAPFPDRPNLEDVLARSGPADSVVSDIAGRFGFAFLPLTGQACSPGCKPDRDGGLLYRDDDHLSAFGSRTLLAPVFERILAKSTAQTSSPESPVPVNSGIVASPSAEMP